jgi:hypothetical protein
MLLRFISAAHSVSQSLLHLADLGASLRNFQSSLTWGLRITQEFLAQGDRELSLGLPVGPMNSKDQPSLSVSQVGIPTHHNSRVVSHPSRLAINFASLCLQPGFILHMVMPLCEAMSEFGHPVFQELLENGRSNMKLWSESSASVSGEPPRKKSR